MAEINSTTGHEQEIIDVAGLKASLKKGGNKAVYNEAICSTAGATAAKVTNTTPPSFSLVSGATIIVKFTYAISVANATLKVGDADAKPIYYQGAALAANMVNAGDRLLLRYDGTNFNVIGSLGAIYESKQASQGGTDVSLVTTGEKYAWNQKQDVITDGAQIGLGLGVSSEAATVSDRTATISNFIMLKNMPVTITFNNAINVMNATLNISSTGAKPIFIKGAVLQAGVVKAGDVVTLVYDGTNWNIIDILTVDVSASDLYVDMGLPSGLLWAIANIDVTTQSGFAEVDGKPSPFKYECTFFSWGNTEGHNPISDSAFSYDWGTGNNGPYAQTPGSKLTANAGLSFDAARAILGAPWRDPSIDDFVELFNNIDFVQADGETVIDTSQVNKLVTVNNVVGIYLKSKINGRLLFFPCSGYGNGQSWGIRGSYGSYWSRSIYLQTNGSSLGFRSGGVLPQDSSRRFNGFSRRAVQ